MLQLCTTFARKQWMWESQRILELQNLPQGVCIGNRGGIMCIGCCICEYGSNACAIGGVCDLVFYSATLPPTMSTWSSSWMLVASWANVSKPHLDNSCSKFLVQSITCLDWTMFFLFTGCGSLSSFAIIVWCWKLHCPTSHSRLGKVLQHVLMPLQIATQKLWILERLVYNDCGVPNWHR